MTPDELQDLTHHLVDAHEDVTKHLRRRPRKAAKGLCQEFRTLLQREDFWNQLTITTRQLEPLQKDANEILGDIKRLIRTESDILAKLGIDESAIGNIIKNVYDAVDIAEARTADTSPQGIRNLQDRLSTATDLICKTSKGPILHAMDYVVSAKGALTLAALGIGAANIWCAVTLDGGAISHASIKVAVGVAHGHLGGIIHLLG
jgi:hypothetical protein